MHKSYKKTIAILVACALIGALFCFSVSADTGDFFIVPIAKPPASDNMGYVEVLARDLAGNLFVEVYIFTLSTSTVTNNGGYDATDAYVLFSCNEHNLYFYPDSIGGRADIDLSLYYVGSNGSFSYLGRVTDSTITASFGSTLVGMHIYGDVSISNTVGTTPFTVVYGEDAASYNTLLSILSVLQNNNQDIIANDNQNAQDIQDNQDKNTQSIIDNQNDLAEQEKNEIQSSGNQATDAMDSIPNESEGFINALGTFVSTMSTTDTSCSITFPAIKTPSFAGIPGATLSEEYEVDFAAAISLIPSDIMKLIRALTTIALIVFCFKELYDTISEALTRKKASSDG